MTFKQLFGLVCAHAHDLGGAEFDQVSLKKAAQDILPDVAEVLASLKPTTADTDGKTPGGKEACEKCIMGTSKLVMEHVFSMVDKKCKKEAEPHAMASVRSTMQVIEGSSTTVVTEETAVILPSDPSKKDYFCMFWQKDKEVAEGFLIAMVRPAMDSFFYCLGSKQCTHKSALESPALIEVDAGLQLPDDLQAMNEEVQRLHPGWEPLEEDEEEHHGPEHDAPEHHDEEEQAGIFQKIAAFFSDPFSHHKHDDDHHWGHHGHHHGHHHGQKHEEEKDGKGNGEEEVALFEDANAEPSAEPAIKGEGKGKGKGKGHVCKKCYVKTFRTVMKMAVGMTKKICEKTQCPYMKGFCAWGKEHPKMAYGVIMGKVEPWKYAIGRCYRKGPKGKGKGHHKGKGKNDKKGKGKDDKKGKGKGKGDDDGKGNGKGDDDGPQAAGDDDAKGKGKGEGHGAGKLLRGKVEEAPTELQVERYV